MLFFFNLEFLENLKKKIKNKVLSVNHKEKVAQRSYGLPIPGRVQGQVGQGSLEQWKVSLPAHNRGLQQDDFKAPSNPNHFVTLWFY